MINSGWTNTYTVKTGSGSVTLNYSSLKGKLLRHLDEE